MTVLSEYYAPLFKVPQKVLSLTQVGVSRADSRCGMKGLVGVSPGDRRT